MIRALEIGLHIPAFALMSCALAAPALGQATQNPPLVAPPASNAPPPGSAQPNSTGAPSAPPATNVTPASVAPASGSAGAPGAASAPITAPPPAAPGTSAVQTSSIDEPAFSAGVGYLHQFEANLDRGATVSVDRFYASFSSRLYSTTEFSLSLAMASEVDWYHWSGTSTLGVSKPFGTVALFGFQLRSKFKLSEELSMSVAGIFGMAGETDADAGSSLYGGGMASLNWSPNPNLLLGVGILGVTQIEDGGLVIPIPIVHWKFSDVFVLSSIRRPPASPFVGLDLAWEPLDTPMDVSIGLAWQQRRFRLGSNSVASLNNGVGEDSGMALLFGFGYDFSKDIRLDLFTGFNFAEQLQVENSVGRQFRNTDVSSSAILGAFLTFRF